MVTKSGAPSDGCLSIIRSSIASCDVSRMRLSVCTIWLAKSRSSSYCKPPASVSKTLRGSSSTHSCRTISAPLPSRSGLSLLKSLSRWSMRGVKWSWLGAIRARASMSSRTTSSDALVRQPKSAGQICCESCMTRGALFLSSMCTQWSDATRVGTYCEPRCDESAWSSVCISNCASCDCCSSVRSVASARDAASRISSSTCESDDKIALSTCAQKGRICSRPWETNVWSHEIAERRENLSCDAECWTSTWTIGAYATLSASRISCRNSCSTEKVCWRISLLGSASMWKSPSKKMGRCCSSSMSGTESSVAIHPTRNWREKGLET
mmetsp:Transcript_72801/g.218606  ORF Transcript_72801/g.218606 Transcript_72801/m.218606 type:complete len:324 (+) Transcript_72801:1019-1990(+)